MRKNDVVKFLEMSESLNTPIISPMSSQESNTFAEWNDACFQLDTQDNIDKLLEQLYDMAQVSSKIISFYISTRYSRQQFHDVKLAGFQTATQYCGPLIVNFYKPFSIEKSSYNTLHFETECIHHSSPCFDAVGLQSQKSCPMHSV